jgi:hypothetical protein
MSRPAIPADLRRFIVLAIPSVPYLEALLLMRSAGSAGLNAGSLAAALYVNHKTAAALLGQLKEAGLIELAPAPAEEHYCYAPSADHEPLINRLAEEYANNLVGISMLIHSSGMKESAEGVQYRGKS